MIIMVLPGFKSQRLGKFSSEVGSGFQPLGGSGAEPDPAPLGVVGPACRSGHRGTKIYLGSSLNINQSLGIKAGSRVTQFLFCVFYPNNPLTQNVGSSWQEGSVHQGTPE